MGYDRLYFLKKAYAIYPGVVRPVSGGFLAAHYAARRAQRGAARAVLDAVVGAAFMAWIPWRARRVQKRFGLDAAARRRIAAIARARFADPQEVALFRIETPAAMDSYVRRFEDAALNKRVNPKGWTPSCALADKAAFYRRCAASDLPHPPLVALMTRGRLEVFADPAGRELLAKPANGEGGKGLVMLGPVADAEDLAVRVAGQGGTVVVQPRIATHPDLVDLALNALPTARVVTILDESGAPEVVSSTFRFASDPAAEVDNMKAGGLMAAVDLETGRLGIACRGYGGGDHALHPVTGAPIVGRALPLWPQVKALAVQAHAAAFGDYALVGWDIAVSPEGPLLIEGNGKPGVLMPQRAARRGIGEGRYGVLLAHHLATKP